MNEEGGSVEDELGLNEIGSRHFAHILSDDKQTDLLEQLRVVMLYPNMISPVDAPCLTQPVSLVEIEVPFAPLRRTGASD